MGMDPRGKAVIKASLLVVAIVTMGWSKFSNDSLVTQTKQRQAQIEKTKAAIKRAKAAQRTEVKSLPNVYQTIRQQANQVMALQMQLMKINQVTDKTRYDEVLSQLKPYINTYSNTWNAVSQWSSVSNWHFKLALGGIAAPDTYKVMFLMYDKNDNFMGAVQALYNDGQFGNITVFQSGKGSQSQEDTTTAELKKFNTTKAQADAQKHDIEVKKELQKATGK